MCGLLKFQFRYEQCNHHHHPSAPSAGMFASTVFQRSRSSIALPRSSGPMPVSRDNIMFCFVSLAPDGVVS